MHIGLLSRAVLAFVALPGMVAYVVPIALAAADGRERQLHLSGWILLALGTIVMLWCVREFYTAGKGTLAPWAPPRELVVTGLYSYSRNPMYLGVLIVLAGWAAGFQSRTLTIYALAIAIAFHLRVILHEEPYLTRTYGIRWTRYRSRVPRWLGGRPGADPADV